MINKILYIVVAIFYNLFAHTLSGLLFKNMQFDLKKENTTLLLLFLGIMGIVVSKILAVDDTNNTLSDGLYYGGILLLLTVILDNWQAMTEESHFIIISIGFGGILWYAYNKNQTD